MLIGLQIPDNYVTKEVFDAVNVYIIPKPQLQGCVLTVSVLTSPSSSGFTESNVNFFAISEMCWATKLLDIRYGSSINDIRGMPSTSIYVLFVIPGHAQLNMNPSFGSCQSIL